MWKLKNNNNIKDILNKRKKPELILFKDYDKYKNYKEIDFNYSEKYYFKDKIDNFKNILNKTKILYDKNLIKNIIKFQKNILNKNIILRGPAYINRKLSINHEDFYTLENIKNINNKEFFSYKDNEDFIYSFNINTINEIIKGNKINPYSTKKIPQNIIKNVKHLLKNKIKVNKIIKKQSIRERTFEIFQKIDFLDNYTDISWFLDLNINKYKLLYRYLEDIWNYRIMVHQNMNDIRKKVVPLMNVFQITVNEFFKYNNKNKIQNILLDNFDKLISSGKNRADKQLGAMWCLTALTEVSKTAAIALPHLVQI